MKIRCFFYKNFNRQVLEFDLDYTDENCISTTNNQTCAQVLQNANYTGVSCSCIQSFELKEDFTVKYFNRINEEIFDESLQGDVYFYYGLVNYYQNHRRYVRSRDDNQLLGKDSAVATECEPYERGSLNGTTKDYAPCGAIANSKFNGEKTFHLIEHLFLFVIELDSLSLTYNGNQTVPFLNTGIAWSTDREVKFKNPSNPKTCKSNRKANRLCFNLLNELNRF